MVRWHRLAAVCAAASATLASAGGQAGGAVVLVTGATGRTGVLLYKALQEKGITVRGLVRNATKAREVLGCSKCDESEGIFVADVTKKETLTAAMSGTTALAITTSAVPVCQGHGPMPSCTYPEGAFPVDVDFHGGKAQIEAFAEAGKGSPGPVALCSSMGSTDPNNFLDKLGNGHILFYKLNLEAYLMSSGVPFTIVKPCGLGDGPAQKQQLVVGHDDEVQERPPMISRADVARVMAEALVQPAEARDLRFDLCAKVGPATADVGEVFKAARYPWQLSSKVTAADSEALV